MSRVISSARQRNPTNRSEMSLSRSHLLRGCKLSANTREIVGLGTAVLSSVIGVITVDQAVATLSFRLWSAASSGGAPAVGITSATHLII